MADSIFDKYRNLENPAASSVADTGSNIFEKYRSMGSPDKIVPPPENPAYPEALKAGVTRGALDVGDTLDPILQPTVGKLFGKEPSEERRKLRRQQTEEQYGDNPTFAFGRMAGQLAITAPLVPANAIRAGFQSAPAVAALGQGVVNRLGTNMALGSAGGATYGALTNAANDEGLASNVAFNAGMGAAGAPLIAGAGKLGSMVIPGVRSLKANAEILMAAKNAGIAPSAIKNVIARLNDEGLTPEQAKLELARLGSKGTLADLGPSLQTEASGLASLSGKPTSILKNRFGERGEQANNAARDLVTSRLGPKPDLEAEKEAIVNRAQILTTPDYKAAKASGAKLDTSNISAHIDSELDKAVGKEASELQKIKGYLYNSKGNLKDDVASLHKIRIAIDDRLGELPKEGSSQASGTYRAVSNIRDLVDARLKTVPEMVTADANFARHMKVKEGLQIGYDALTKQINKEEFNKVFNASAPEMQDTIRKGIRAAIGDVMERGSQGEASSAAKLFNKKEVNREILRTAFGARGDSVLDAIHDEVAQRGTERAVQFGAQTAERRAVQERYKGSDRPHIGDMALGAAIDAYGAGGAATGIMAGKHFLSNRMIALSSNRLGQLTEGTADLLSRQSQHGRDVGMDVVEQVGKIQSRLQRPSMLERISLPRLPTLAAPFGGRAYDQISDKTK